MGAVGRRWPCTPCTWQMSRTVAVSEPSTGKFVIFFKFFWSLMSFRMLWIALIAFSHLCS
jgi:hypothetical protein